MLFELLEAVEFGKEVGGIAQGLINGDHYDAVDKAISMCDAIDYNAPTWREEINEILDTISCVNKNDRAFVRAAATFIRACCYFDLGDYAKSRQSISECSMISVDSWTINKDVILDFQKRARELRKEIDKQNYSQTQIESSQQTSYYESGNKYIGPRDNYGAKCGYGQYFYANGSRYEGNFENNKFSGYGVYYSIDGSRYEGNFENNQFSGHGVYYFKDGSRYDGYWLNNVQHGYGQYFNGNNQLICRGKWMNGQYEGDN